MRPPIAAALFFRVRLEFSCLLCHREPTSFTILELSRAYWARDGAQGLLRSFLG